MATKRRKVASGRQYQSQRLDAFLRWMKDEARIWWDENLLSIDGGVDGCSGVAIGVVAKQQVRAAAAASCMALGAFPMLHILYQAWSLPRMAIRDSYTRPEPSKSSRDRAAWQHAGWRLAS